jgi:uncharacterized membrane protein (UPF0127 family)
MNERKLLIMAGILLSGLAVAYFIFSVSKPHLPSIESVSPKTSVPSSPNVTIGSTIYHVEIADTPALQAHGLSDRSALKGNAGMLFIFPQKGRDEFWMKDMHFPLDFVWIDGSTIVDLTENVPSPRAGELNLPIYQPRQAVDKVLEINAGEVTKHGFTIGDTLRFTP